MSDTTTQPRPRGTTTAQVLALVAGGLIGLLALGLIAAGGVALWGEGQKDAQGYVATGSDPFSTRGYALATDNLDVDSDVPGWVATQDDFGKVRLQVTPHGDKPVFVGIAPTSEVSRYLGESAHSTVRDLEYSPFRVDYTARGGDRRPAPPTAQDFWDASARGSGTQTMTWDVRHGNWSVVVMNADGSRGVDTGISAGVRLPFLSAIGWSTIGGGAVLLLTAGGLFYLGLRTPRGPHGGPAPRGAAPAAA
jgi:hypothetical protein